MSIFKRTKILATIGPATNSREAIKELIQAGANGFRLNFSHGNYEEREEQIAWIRELSRELERPVAIVQDLQGPKIRLGELNDNRQEVKRGDILTLTFGGEHNGLTMPVQYNLAEKVKPGEDVYLFDGKIHTVVKDVISDTAITVEVMNDGYLMSKKGINLPDSDFGGDILTPKDLRDIEFGAKADIDFVALSFVQSDEDINNLRQILVSHESTAQIIAKIETKAAVEEEMLKKIVQASDGVMIARGDMAVEVGPETVPIIQRKAIALCRAHGKISIVATQMMVSMVDSQEPTRAEVSDVATAAIQGADTVMLSDETANGSYPTEAVKAMRKTLVYTQENWLMNTVEQEDVSEEVKQRDAIANAAVQLANQLDVTAIVAETKTGATAANIAACRPNVSIIAVTSEPRSAQQLALNYATRSFIRPDGEKAGLTLAKELFANKYFGDEDKLTFVIVSGNHPGITGGTDTIRVRVVE